MIWVTQCSSRAATGSRIRRKTTNEDFGIEKLIAACIHCIDGCFEDTDDEFRQDLRVKERKRNAWGTTYLRALLALDCNLG